MKRNACVWLFALGCGVFLTCATLGLAADETAKVGGAWEMTRESRRGPTTRTLTIQQDGSTIKGTETVQGEGVPLEGTVTGNKISFTVKRDTPRGTFTFTYTGTVEGDSMQGTFHSERYDGKWSAKRTSSGSKKQ